MNTSNAHPPTRETPPRLVAAPRRRSAPRGRRGIGARWHRRGEWRSLVTGGVATRSSRTPRRAWMSLVSIAAIATVAGAAIGIGATRLGWLPATGAAPIALAIIAFVASGVFAIVACCAEIDGVTGEAGDAKANRDPTHGHGHGHGHDHGRDHSRDPSKRSS